MVRGHPRAWSLVALTVATLFILLAALVVRVGRPYPGFFVAPDFRVFPSSPAPVAVEWGDRIVSVEGRSPVTLEARAASGGSAIRYEIERSEERRVGKEC